MLSCGSPTSTATGSPPLPPARNTGSSLTWNYATGAGPDARTGSAAPRTPGCATCPCTASHRTRCGARSSRSPVTCSPGCRCSPSRAKPAGGNRNGCGCGSSPAPGASSVAAAASSSASPPAGPGPRRSSPRLPVSRPSHPADQPEPIPATRKDRPAGPWNPAGSARQPGHHADQPPKKAARGNLKPPNQDHERCRLKWRTLGVERRKRSLGIDHAISAVLDLDLISAGSLSP